MLGDQVIQSDELIAAVECKLVLNAPAKEVKICVRRLFRSPEITRKTIRDKTFLLPVASILGDPRRKLAASHVQAVPWGVIIAGVDDDVPLGGGE